MAKITFNTLSDLNNKTSFLTALNENFSDLSAFLDTLVSRNGTSPNTMTADLDVNSNDINNVSTLRTQTLILGGQTITAATSLASSDPNTVDATVLLDESITTAKIADEAVTLGKLDPALAAMLVTIPAGAVFCFAMDTPPAGYLECDGSAVSRATYATLFAAIGTTWGVGDGSTTFNLPDFRGEFLRGWDNGKGTDAARAFASSQSGANEAHTHSVSGNTATDGSHTHRMTYVRGSEGSGGVTDPDGFLSLVSDDKLSNSYNNDGVVKGHNSTHKHTISLTSGSSGGTEARPRNIAVLYAIKT